MRTRELLLKNFDIVSICSFGPNTFGQTNTSTVVLFLRRKALEPDLSKHVQNRIDEWFKGNMADNGAYKDSENLAAYIKHMGYSYEDYVKLLNNELTDAFLETDMAKDYVKALNINKQGKNSASTSLAPEARKVREEAQKFTKSRGYKDLTPAGKLLEERRFTLNFIREIEKEKLYYYLLAASNPQPVLVVQSPLNETKKDRKEQQFLGYEWSNAKGREGIHYLNTGEIKKSNADDEDADDDTISQIMGVDGIVTPLFSPLDLSNKTKVNSLVCGNFTGSSNDIPEDLEAIVHEYALTDMLNFTRVEFDKELSTSVAYKLNFESKYPLIPLKRCVELNPSKSELKDMDDNLVVSFVEMSSVSENGYISFKEDKLYKDVKGSYTYFAEDDLIFAKITPCMENGKCAIATGLSNGIGFGSSEFHVFRCQKEILNSYLFALLNTNEVRWYAKKNMKGSSGHRRVPVDFYASLEIPMPPMDVQKKIAEECEKIDKNFRDNISELDSLKHELSDYINNIQYGTVKLSSFCAVKGGKRIPKGLSYVETPTGHPYIRVADFSAGTVDTSNLIYITDDVFNKIKAYTISSDDVYISIAGTIGTVGTIPSSLSGANLTENAAKLVFDKKKVNKDYLAAILTSSVVQEQIINATKTVGVPKLALHRIENLQIQLPALDVQNEIAEHVNEVKRKIEKAKIIIDSCPSAKQAILDKYLK